MPKCRAPGFLPGRSTHCGRQAALFPGQGRGAAALGPGGGKSGENCQSPQLQDFYRAAVPTVAARWRSSPGRAAGRLPWCLVVVKVRKRFKVQSSRIFTGPQYRVWPPGGALPGLGAEGRGPPSLVLEKTAQKRQSVWSPGPPRAPFPVLCVLVKVPGRSGHFHQGVCRGWVTVPERGAPSSACL